MIPLVFALAAGLSVAAAPSVEVQRIDGRRVTGTIDHCDGVSLQLATAEGPQSLRLDRLASLAVAGAGSGAAAGADLRVHLADGSVLPARQYTSRQGKASVVLVEGSDLELPQAEIVAVRFRPAPPGSVRSWQALIATQTDADLLVVEKGQSLDYLRGRIEEVGEELVRFELDGDLLPVKRAKLFGLRYYRSARPRHSAPGARLTDAAGAVWAVETIESDGSQVRWTTPLDLERAMPLARLVRIDFAQANVVYLSDLTPQSHQWTPYFEAFGKVPSVARFFAPHNDRSLSSGPLKLNGKTYRRGLALHSRTVLTYRLGENFQRFQATAGIDDSVRPGGQVQLVIRGDDRVLLDSPVSGVDPPLPVDLDVTGIRRLTIVVDFGEDLDVGDHLDLGEARLLK